MTVRLLPTAVLGALRCVSVAQTASPAAAVSFEAADVHASPTRLHPFVHGGMVHGDRYLLRDANLLDLISTAYQVDPTSVFGGPAWLEFDRFDIHAKTPAATSDANARLMLRALLAERFQLIAHPGARPLPAFVISAAKTLKLKRADASAEPGGCQYQPPPKDAPAAVAMSVKFSCQNTTMQAFAEILHDVSSPYSTDRWSTPPA